MFILFFYQKELFSSEITFWPRLLRNQFFAQGPNQCFVRPLVQKFLEIMVIVVFLLSWKVSAS